MPLQKQTLEFLIQTFPDLRVLLLIRSKPDQFLPDRQRDILDRATDIFVINVIFFLNGLIIYLQMMQRIFRPNDILAPVDIQ